MFCSICTHPKQAEIIDHYIHSGSLRRTANHFGVGYRSIQRHIDFCIASIQAGYEQANYKKELGEVFELLKLHFSHQRPKPRPKSIIKKQVNFTWSKRAWKAEKRV